MKAEVGSRNWKCKWKWKWTGG